MKRLNFNLITICMVLILSSNVFSQDIISKAQSSNEIEPNDKAGIANPVNLDASIIGTLDRNSDLDWYRVFIPGTGRLYLSVVNPPIEIKSQIALYNKHLDYLYVTASAVNQGDDIFLTYDVITTGFYYIQMKGTGGQFSNDTYQLNIDFTFVTDNYEPNNTIGNAKTLTSTSINGYIFDRSDKDWYQIYLEINDELNVTLTSPMDMKSNICLYDANFQYMYVNATAVNSGDTTYLNHTSEKQGIYYISIKDNNSLGHIEPYLLDISGGRINYIPHETPITNENEPNDSICNANLIKIGDAITGNIQEVNDNDIYTFYTNTPGQLTIQLDTIPENLKLRMILSNSSNRHLLSGQSSSAGDVFSVIYDTTQSERLYLKIDALEQGFSDNSYSFSTHFIAVEDRFEPNDNFGDAAFINQQNRISGYTFKTGDNDWYKIHVDTPGELEIIVSDLPKNIRPVIKLYNASKEHLSSKTGISGMDISLVYSTTEPGDYFIQFYAYGNNNESTYPYTMTIFGADFGLFAPIATIDTIIPGSIIFGDSITFSGFGEDLDGDIVAYSWGSDIDGNLSNASTFSTSSLSKGTHNIYFKVKDDSGIWSSEVSDVVYVGSNVSDESEPNNKIGHANEIALGHPLTSKIQEQNDIDWFKIIVSNPGRLTLSVTNVPDNLKMSMQLYNRHTQYLYVTSQGVSEGDSIELIYDISETGIYYIRISAASGHFSSEFTYTFLGSFIPAIDPYEPNNSFLNVFYMSENSAYGQKFPSNDKDYYAIWADANIPLSVTLSEIPHEMKGQIHLYGRNHNYLYATAQAQNPGDELSLDYTPSETGYLYITIRDSLSKAYPNQTYHLEVSGARPDYAPTEIPGSAELEPNNTFADASFIALDMPQTGKFDIANDQDYFCFSMPFSGILHATLDHVPENIRPRLRILKRDQSQITYRDATNPGDTLMIDTNITTPGKYYVRLESLDRNITSNQAWKLSLSATQVLDPYEPNNNFGDAPHISDMNYIQAYIFDAGDTDWYQISVDQPGTVRITITDVPFEIRPQIELYNNHKERMAYKLATNYGQELTLDTEISSPDIYFICIRDTRNNTFSSDPYTLIINGARFNSFTPQAYIDTISPLVAQVSESILFEGHGFDQDGEIIAYSWRSSVNDHISDSRVFSLDNLSAGTHTIYLKVKDNDQNWSSETSTIIYVGVEAPQEQEPNNLIGEANKIECDIVYPGSIEKSGDYDFYQLMLNQPGRLTLDITNPTSNPMRTSVEMYNPDADYMYLSASASNLGDPVTLIQDITESGIYTFRVRDLNNNTDSKYSLTASFLPVSDPYEPNASIQAAKTITAGEIINAWIFPSQDQDWYKITLDKPGTLTLNLTNVPSNLKGHISVYDENNQYSYVTGIAQNDGDNVHCIYHAESPGVYFIKFYNQNNQSIPDHMYEMSVNFQAAFDQSEPNASFRTATWLNQSSMNAYMFPSADIDYYAFYAEKGAHVQIKIHSVPQDLKLKLDLYNKDWGYMYVNEKASASGEPITLNVDVEDTGIYYIKVSDQNNAFTSEAQYSIYISGSQLDYSLPIEPLTEEIEYNDKYWCANPIGFSPLSGSFASAGDRDWFRIVLSEPGLLKIHLKVPSNIQSKIELYQLNASRTAENIGESQTMIYSVSDLSNPYIYLIISDVNNTISNGTYEVQIEFEPINDIFEPNHDIGVAAAIQPGTTHSAYIFSKGDIDWYEISIEQAGIFKLIFQEVPDTIDIYATLYNRNKQNLGRKQALNPGAPIELSYHISEKGNYYIAIQDTSNNAQSSQPYRFIVNHTVIQDPGEPDSSFRHATLIDYHNQVSSSVIFPENDHDWYKFYVHETGNIRIQLTETYGIDANLVLYNDSKSQLANWKVKNIGDIIDRTHSIPAPDFYYIKISDQNENNISSIPYKLTVSKISCEHSFPFATIMDIKPNPVLTGEEIEFIAKGWDADGEISTYEWQSSIDGLIGNSEILRLNHLSKGKHVIGLRVIDNENNKSASVYKNLYVVDSIQYEKEYNNHPENAIPVSLNKWIKGRIYPINDDDYYKFYIPQRGLLETIIDTVPESMASIIYFYDENGTYLYKSASSMNEGDRVTTSFFVDPGWYYAKLSDKGRKGHLDQYGLLFKYTQAYDPFEPANIISMAKEIQLNTEFSNALICPEGDYDFYKVTISEPGRLSIDLFDLPETMKIAVELYNQDLTYVYLNKQAINNGENVHLSCDINDLGICYIRIRDTNNQGYTLPYTFKNTFTPVVDLNEPNNKTGNAKQVTSNIISSFIFPTNDSDYYRIYANANDVLNLVLSGPDNMRGSLSIYNFHFNYTYSNQQANNSGDIIYLSYTIPDTGFYYIKVHDLNNGAYVTPYSLEISGITLDNVPQFSPVTNEIESNDNYGFSNDISLEMDITGTFDTVGDKDWFRFYINSPGILNVAHTHIPDQIRSAIYLYDVNKGQLNYRTTTNDSEDNILVHSITQPGYYFIMLHDHGNNNSSLDAYTLHLSHFPVTDAHEPNDSYGQAAHINESNIQAYIFDAADEDWYRFYMRDPGMISISLAEVPENIRPYLRLYNSEKSQLKNWLATNNGQTGTDLITYNIEKPGFYFITFHNHGQKTDSNVPYIINISGVDFSTSPQLAPIGDRVIEPGIDYSFMVNGSDPDNPENLVYSVANLPPGATFDPDTRLFSWKPTKAQSGSYPGIHFSLSDNTYSDSEDITITVRNFMNPPVLTHIGDKTIVVSQELSFIISATDPNNDENLVFSATNLPHGAEFDPQSKIFTWTPSQHQIKNWPDICFEVSNGVWTDFEYINIEVIAEVRLATVETGIALNIQSNQAILTGKLIDNGGSDTIEMGFIYSESPDFSIDSTSTIVDDNFQNKLLNLKPRTRYYYKAYATNEKGTAYGEDKTFITHAIKVPGDINLNDKIDLQDVIMLMERILEIF